MPVGIGNFVRIEASAGVCEIGKDRINIGTGTYYGKVKSLGDEIVLACAEEGDPTVSFVIQADDITGEFSDVCE